MAEAKHTATAQDIKERVRQFMYMELPGQPMGVHMGTSYLVNDMSGMIDSLTADRTRLAEENARLRAALEEIANGEVTICGTREMIEAAQDAFDLIKGQIRAILSV